MNNQDAGGGCMRGSFYGVPALEAPWIFNTIVDSCTALVSLK